MYYTPEQLTQIQRRADEIAASSSFRDPGEPSLWSGFFQQQSDAAEQL